MGTPAEEGQSGKVYLEEAGSLKDIDAAMMVHPASNNTSTDAGCLARVAIGVEFHGKSSHAGGSPHLGINALDAMNLLFAAIGCWRQQLPEPARVHGVITHGGDLANIIPSHTQANFYVRSDTYDEALNMLEHFKRMVEGASLMTGCTHTLDLTVKSTKPRIPNTPMNNLYKEAMETLGHTVHIPSRPGRGSTDFGNFSSNIPGIHPYFKTSTVPVAGHSIEKVAASNSELGRNSMLQAAAMGTVAYTFLQDEAFRNEVVDYFTAVTKK